MKVKVVEAEGAKEVETTKGTGKVESITTAKEKERTGMIAE